MFDYGFPNIAGIFLFLIPLAVAQGVVWKGIAMWRAARNGHTAWYVALLVVNSAGILPIIYIFGFSRRGSAAPQG